MIQYLQNRARDYGIQNLRLETLTQNIAGKGLYQSLGFKWERDLLVLTTPPGQIIPTSRHADIRPTTAPSLLKYYATFHQTRAPWQRSLQSLHNREENMQGLAYWQNEHLIGYLLYETHVDTYAIHDLAIAPDCQHPIHVGQTLLRALHTTRTDMGSYIINIPTTDTIAAAFTELNYRIAQRQYEMIWQG